MIAPNPRRRSKRSEKKNGKNRNLRLVGSVRRANGWQDAADFGQNPGKSQAGKAVVVSDIRMEATTLELLPGPDLAAKQGC
jgi:hypothetical protein